MRILRRRQELDGQEWRLDEGKEGVDLLMLKR